ncbi:MAG: hypothetical protein Q8L81_02465 [Bacteroidota bacterium]|nr:hypothetical protein [Bacteroidota bacterium]
MKYAMEEENKNKEVNEPRALYKSKEIKIYSSFEEAAEAEAFYVANQDPIERIRETVQLILKVFPINEKIPNTDKIYIDRS